MRKKVLFTHQSAFLQVPMLFMLMRFFFLVAGYGAGKTSGLVDVLEYYVTILQGKKDVEGHNPRILLGGVTLAHLMKTTLKYFFEDLDAAKIPYRVDTKYNIITVGNVDIILVSLSAPESIVGFDACAGFLDEIDDLGSVSNADEVTFQAFRAANERCRQRIKGFRKPFICFASTSQGQKGLYRIYTMFKKTGTAFVLIKGRTEDNTSLDPDYVESLRKTYTPKEQEVYLHGEFFALSSGKVFGDFDWDRNFLTYDLDESVGKEEAVYWGQDFNAGYHRGCAFLLRRGIVYAIKRYEFEDIREAPSVVRHDFPHAVIYFIPDTTVKENITNYAKELRRYGIRLIYRKKNPLVEDSAFLVNKLLYTGRLLLCPLARETAEALAVANRDKNNEIPKGTVKNSPIHDCDAVRLVCNYLASNKAELNDIRRATIARHEYLQDEDDVKQEMGGYTNMSPEAI